MKSPADQTVHSHYQDQGFVHTIFVDFGNVLAAFDRGRAAKNIARLYHRTEPDLAQVQDMDQFLHGEHGMELLRRFESGEIHYERYRSMLCDQRRRMFEIDPDAFWRARSDMFTLIPAMVDFCARLRQAKVKADQSRHVRVIGATNTDEKTILHLRKMFDEIGLFFDDIVTSYSARAMKPKRAFYDHALQCAGVGANECFLVDDMEENVLAARGMGIRSFYFAATETQSIVSLVDALSTELQACGICI